MKLKLEIDCDNAAFEDENEIMSILRKVVQTANRYRQDHWHERKLIHDAEGNTLGFFVVED